ncbi:MAG: Homeodomain-like [Anaerolineae bacterium]|jgi:AcrR family transcriptional regulator|nr:MAG: Homeodomain-like [Anaerolineae bacterium]
MPENLTPPSSTAEQILEVATTYFARYGYHGTSIRALAQEIGISVATLYYHVQSKDELYRRVFQRQFLEEERLIRQIIDQADEHVIHDAKAFQELVFRLIDALLDRSLNNPDIVRLWTRRWLEKPEKTEEIEFSYSAPLYQQVEDLLARAAAAGVIKPRFPNLSMIVHSFTWLHYGYIGFGQLTYQARFEKPSDPHQVAQFRQFVRLIYCELLGFQSGPSET